MNLSSAQRTAVGLAATLTIGLTASAVRGATTALDPLHGYCAVGCIDNGTNSPTSQNPPQNFGFTVSPGPASGDLLLKILTPNNETAGPSFTVTDSQAPTATASLLPGTWTSGTLEAFLTDVPGASPNNPIGAYLPSTQALDPGATGFHVYEADLGTNALQNPSNPNLSPLLNITAGTLPLASYIVGFLNEGTAANPNWVATANSGAIFETSSPPTMTTTAGPIPEPSALALLGSALAAMGFIRRRRKPV
jgi:hypothetical protein